MRSYSKKLIEDVSNLLSKGFNSVEIAEKLDKHEVTIRNIKSQLKKKNK
jgi:DNA-binding NarL/FixJ family response regulator